MKFLFDCDDAVMLPRAYDLVDEIGPFFKKMRQVDVDESEIEKEGMARTVLKNMMKVYPEDTSALLAKLWVLEPGEQPPRATCTIAAFFKSKDAIDFFTSVLPFLTEFSGQL